MADQKEATASSEVLPSPIPVGNFLVSAAGNQFLIGFGNNRIRLAANGDADLVQEWSSSIALSPVTAKQLALNLLDCINKYESKFGTVPSGQE